MLDPNNTQLFNGCVLLVYNWKVVQESPTSRQFGPMSGKLVFWGPSEKAQDISPDQGWGKPSTGRFVVSNKALLRQIKYVWIFYCSLLLVSRAIFVFWGGNEFWIVGDTDKVWFARKVIGVEGGKTSFLKKTFNFTSRWWLRIVDEKKDSFRNNIVSYYRILVVKVLIVRGITSLE